MADEVGQEAEVLLGVLRGDAGDGQVQAAGDRPRDLEQRDALLGNGVQAYSRGRGFESEAVEAGDIPCVRRGPPVAAVA
ncbi:hypothetical protein ACFV42_43875 [Streptomyces solisilvae]|uniref:hypothetical protein n=1 Tax=Streptomyces malaysiensis TaxID=92644 RepID=UPI0036A4BF50